MDVGLGGLSEAAFAPLGDHQWAVQQPAAPHGEDAAALQELEYKISVRSLLPAACAGACPGAPAHVLMGGCTQTAASWRTFAPLPAGACSPLFVCHAAGCLRSLPVSPGAHVPPSREVPLGSPCPPACCCLSSGYYLHLVSHLAAL